MSGRKIAVLIVGGALLLHVGFFLWVYQAMWTEDFSKWPPDKVFTMVWGVTPPAGISRIQASGRHCFIKRWVWLRIQGSDSALRELEALAKAKSGGPISALEMVQNTRNLGSANNRYDAIDKSAVGWDDWERVAHPKYYYCFLGNNQPWAWASLLIFDYKNHTVYMQTDGG